MSHKFFLNVLLISTLFLAVAASAQNSQAPLTNNDVVTMVKGGLPEGTIISAINAQQTNFDVSALALVKLKDQGVSQKVMDAMLNAASKQRAAQPAAPAAPAAAASPSAPAQPKVELVQGAAKSAIPLSKTQIAQTKTKSSSLSALASDNALGQAVQSVAVSAASEAAYRSGSYTAGSAIGGAGSVMSGLMGHKKPTLTYVWALPGQKAETTTSNKPSLEVNFADIPGVNAAEYEPALVKLAVSPNNFRLVGATQAKQDAFEASEWEMYSSFMEDRVAVQPKNLGPGHYSLEPSATLPAGEYGVVLRPVNKTKKFSGSSVAQNSGEGVLFNSVWAFSVK